MGQPNFATNLGNDKSRTASGPLFPRVKLRAVLTWSFFPVVMVLHLLGAWALLESGMGLAASGLIPMIVGSCVILLMEFAHPETPRWKPESSREVGVHLLHLLVSGEIPSKLAKIILLGFALEVSARASGWLGFGFWPASWPVFAQLALALVINEAIAYWIHRTFHSSSTLWPLHTPHHSITRFNMLAGFRMHPVQTLPSRLVRGAVVWPIVPAEILVLLAVFRVAIGNLQHCNVKMKTGWLNYVLATPDNHRLHHALAHCQCNYGSNLAIFDLIFRTLHIQKKADIASRRLGLPPEFAVAETFLGQMAMPLSWRTYQSANDSLATGELPGIPGTLRKLVRPPT